MGNAVALISNVLASMDAQEGESAHTSPYAYGAVALVVLLLLLFLVTRLNIDR